MYKLILFITVFLLLQSCNELPNPETIKGMQLGLDYNEQIKVAKSNELCQNINPENVRYYYNNKKIPSTDKCIYRIENDFYAIVSSLQFDIYKGKKILSSVEIMIYSSENPTVINDFFGEHYQNLAFVTLPQAYKVKKMFDKKYGKSQELFKVKRIDLSEYGITKWTDGDLVIKLEYLQKFGFLEGCFMCWATYEYNKKYKDILKSNSGNF